MSWTSVGGAGTGASSGNNQASLAVSGGGPGSPPVGDVLVVLLAVDNAVAADGADDCISSITDAAGNVWQRAGSFSNAQGAAQAGATIDVWWCQITTEYPISPSFTLNFNNATVRDASAATAWQFRPALGAGVKLRATATLADDGVDPSSLNVTTLDAEMLRIRAIAGETSSNISLTVTNGWTALTPVRSGAGTSATEMTVRGEFIISSGTGAASDPSYSSADQASLYIVLQEIPVETTDDLLLKTDAYVADALTPIAWNKTLYANEKAFLTALNATIPFSASKTNFAKALKQKRLSA